mmetsp:Transcript_25178/g.39000  ORF Transcript_25178/g.39000 Transcript_25178/m.39000 type:complete len:187 (+) Transcript_25178:2986-3546(+)
MAEGTFSLEDRHNLGKIVVDKHILAEKKDALLRKYLAMQDKLVDSEDKLRELMDSQEQCVKDLQQSRLRVSKLEAENKDLKKKLQKQSLRMTFKRSFSRKKEFLKTLLTAHDSDSKSSESSRLSQIFKTKKQAAATPMNIKITNIINMTHQDTRKNSLKDDTIEKALTELQESLSNHRNTIEYPLD